MTSRSADSEIKQSANLQDPVAAAELGLERLKRVHQLRVKFPRMERLCQPQLENFWVLGGRPGSFKTAVLWNMALNCAENSLRVLFVSLEVPVGKMAVLACAKFSGLDRRRIESAFRVADPRPFSEPEQNLWDSAIDHFRGLTSTMRMHGADEHGRGIDDVIKSSCLKRFDAVFVDHLGMIGRGNGRELDVLNSAIDRLRALSVGEVVRGYRPWVVATSQLNREIDKGDEERIPRLSDFRGSARIEHDADVAIGLQKRRPEGKDENDPISCVDGFVLKNRNGPEPEVLLFEGNGATYLVTERHREFVPPDDSDSPPERWNDR